MSDNILDRINSAKSNYYSENQKNSFFKNNQKFDCARKIMSNVNEKEIFQRVFHFQNNKIRFDYTLFKTVAHPELYDRMADFIFENTLILLSMYGSYDLDIYASGVTVSGLDRYKDFVQVISAKGLKNGANLLQRLNKVYIYNPPSFLDNAIKLITSIIVVDVTQKIVIIK